MLTKTDLKAIDNLFTKRFREENKPIKEDIAKMRKDINLIVSFFNQEYVNLRTRVERIEEHLHLPVLSS
jgi:hypothetical protein